MDVTPDDPLERCIVKVENMDDSPPIELMETTHEVKPLPNLLLELRCKDGSLFQANGQWLTNYCGQEYRNVKDILLDDPPRRKVKVS